MSDKDKKLDESGVEILPHNYDGIQELDNPLPGWWLTTLYLTIIFAAGYFAYYEIFDGPSSDQYLVRSLEDISAKKKKADESFTENISLDYAQLIADTKMMALGEKQFATKCAACHAAKGEGLIGPNLTDDYWMHSKGDVAGVLKAIKEGYPTKGMPPWDNLIPKKEQVYLAAYVVSLIGTNPPNPKAPQGEKIGD